MTILLTGGGTGGHITPTLAVARELKRLKPEAKIIYVVERDSRFSDLISREPAIDLVKVIYAGKWRRYHGQSLFQKLVDFKTNLLNLRDMIFLVIGFAQSLLIIKHYKPSVVFVKGGFVGLPVGAAASILRRPIITHDSDTLPGLANRIVARWAVITATAFPAEFYQYPKTKIRCVGVPVAENYMLITEAKKTALRQKIGIPESAKMLFVTGGSLGAVRLNKALSVVVPDLLNDNPKLYIVHQTGKYSQGLYGTDTIERLQVYEFLDNLGDFSGAADVVVARPGATTIAELAVQGKACIVVPNPLLAGGHQLKNAEYLVKNNAAVEVPEGEDLSQKLEPAIQSLLMDDYHAAELGEKLHSLFDPNAAETIAMLLLEQSKT